MGKWSNFRLLVVVPFLLFSSLKAEEMSQTSLLLSLLQVQDRIASGDEAAIPLQKHLMFLLGASIAESGGNAELTAQNIRVLLIFGIIGNQADVIETALKEISTPEDKVRLARAVVDYRSRRIKQAKKSFAKIDTLKLDGRLLPFIAFAKGNLFSRPSPKNAIIQYNLVRLTAPGTLLEEASLRRLMALYISAGKTKKFVATAKQYARRFITSPYRKQYITRLQQGLLSMRRTISLTDVGEIGELMPPQFAVSFHMNIMRAALQNGYFKLASFSLEAFVELTKKTNNMGINQIQIDFYKLLTQMNIGEPGETALKLSELEKSKLNAVDMKLYDTAQNVLAAVLSPIDEIDKSSETLKSRAVPGKKMEDKGSEPLEVSSTQRPSGMKAAEDELNEVGLLINKTELKIKAIDEILSE